LQANLRLASSLLLEINRYMEKQGLYQIETPNLIKSTPEGAARLHRAVASTSLQVFLPCSIAADLQQICNDCGLYKYYQIARFFRDETCALIDSPEFSQLDVEMSFATPDKIYTLGRRSLRPRLQLIG